jgi:hypothetical protein
MFNHNELKLQLMQTDFPKVSPSPIGIGHSLFFCRDIEASASVGFFKSIPRKSIVDVSYAAPQAHGIMNVALHQEYSPGIVFIFSQGRKDFYHV